MQPDTNLIATVGFGRFPAPPPTSHPIPPRRINRQLSVDTAEAVACDDPSQGKQRCNTTTLRGIPLDLPVKETVSIENAVTPTSGSK